MRPLPWKALTEPEPGRTYVFVATRFHLRSLADTIRFFRAARPVTALLEGGPLGLVGFSLMARPLARRFWTLSVWEEEGSVERFVGDPTHVAAIRRLRTGLRTFDSVRWSDGGAACPPSWDEALDLLARRDAGR